MLALGGLAFEKRGCATPVCLLRDTRRHLERLELKEFRRTWSLAMRSLAWTLALHLEMVTLRCHLNPTEVLLKQVAFGHRLIRKGSLPWFSPRNKRWSLRKSWEMWDASWELRAWCKSCDAWTQRWRAPHGDSRKMSFHVPLSNCNLSYVYANS